MVRTYKKYIAESKAMIYISIIVALAIRCVFFYYQSPETSHFDHGDGFLWDIVSPFFDNMFISYISSFVLSICISLYLTHINEKYNLIRKRTNLLFALSLLLLSSTPHFVVMNPQLIASLFFLASTDKLFGCYQSSTSPRIAFDFGFFFAIASLFAIDYLIFLPIFWIGLIIMNSFSFKAIFTSLIGIVLIYWIVLFYFIAQNNIEGLYDPFIKYFTLTEDYLPLQDYNFLDWGAFIFSSIIIMTMIFNNYMDNYKDKIRVRANITFVIVIFLFAFTAYALLPNKSHTCLQIALLSASFLVARFFALTESRWQVYLFYISVVFYVSYFIFIFSL